MSAIEFLNQRNVNPNQCVKRVGEYEKPLFEIMEDYHREMMIKEKIEEMNKTIIEKQ
jgi:hypothetical protein